MITVYTLQDFCENKMIISLKTSLCIWNFPLWLEIWASWDSFFVSCLPLLPPLPSSASLPVIWHPLSNVRTRTDLTTCLDKNRPNLPKPVLWGTGFPWSRLPVQEMHHNQPVPAALCPLQSSLVTFWARASNHVGWWCHTNVVSQTWSVLSPTRHESGAWCPPRHCSFFL